MVYILSNTYTYSNTPSRETKFKKEGAQNGKTVNDKAYIQSRECIYV